jgi:hypothetical protein
MEMRQTTAKKLQAAMMMPKKLIQFWISEGGFVVTFVACREASTGHLSPSEHQKQRVLLRCGPSLTVSII